jgi:hypothetical protein
MRDKMRRILSILLVLAFALGPLAPTLDASEDLSLPPCCRRHGAHHCAMAMRMGPMTENAATGTKPIVSVPLTCPDFPSPTALLTGPSPAILSAYLRMPTPVARAQASNARLDQLHSRPGTTHAGRGPPLTI